MGEGVEQKVGLVGVCWWIHCQDGESFENAQDVSAARIWVFCLEPSSVLGVEVATDKVNIYAAEGRGMLGGGWFSLKAFRTSFKFSSDREFKECPSSFKY